MRGRTDLGVSVDEFIPANHPIRRTRELTDQVPKGAARLREWYGRILAGKWYKGERGQRI